MSCKDLQQSLLSANVKIELKQRECNDEKDKNIKLIKQNELLKESQDKLGSNSTDLQLRNEHLLNKGLELEEKIRGIQSSYNILSNNFEQQSKALENQIHDIQALEKELACAQKLRQQLELEQNKLNDQNQSLVNENIKLREEIACLVEVYSEKDRQNLCLTQEHNGLFEEQRRLADRFHQTTDLVSKLNKLSNELNFDNREKNSLIKQLEENINGLHNEIQSLKQEKHELFARLTDCKKCLQDEENKRKTAEKLLANQNQMCQAMEKQISILKKGLNLSKHDIKLLKINFENDIGVIQEKFLNHLSQLKKNHESECQRLIHEHFQIQQKLELEMKTQIAGIVTQKNDEITAMGALLKQKDDELIAVLQTCQRKIDKEKFEIENTLLAAQEEIKVLRDKVNELTAVLQEEHSSHTKHLKTVLLKFHDQEALLKQVQNENELLKKQHSEHEIEVENKILQLDYDKKKLNENIKDLESKLDELRLSYRMEADKSAELAESKNELKKKYDEGKS